MLARAFLGQEARSLSYQSIFGTGGDFDNGGTSSGVRVTQDNALTISAVYACVRMYVDSISTLPADTFVRVDGDRRVYRPRPAWVDEPEPGVSRADFYAQGLLSLLIDGNWFTRVVRNGNGDVVALFVLNPLATEVRRNPLGQIEYVYNNDKVYGASEVIHLTEMRKPGELRGVSRVDQVKETLGVAKALEQFAAAFFGRGTTLSGVIETPYEVTEEQARQIIDGWERHHSGIRKSHKTGLLSAGAKWTKTGVDPEEAQMLQSRMFSVEEVARCFHIPLHMLSVSTPGAMSYASVEQNAIQWVRFSVVPLVSKIEQAFSRLLPGDVFLRLNLDSLLRGDTSTRFSAYVQALSGGFMSLNEVRRYEDLSRVEGGDTLRVPLTNIDLSAASLVETDKRVTMAQRLIQVGFAPASVMAALGLPSIDHTGVPSVQLQGIAQIDPNNPQAVY